MYAQRPPERDIPSHRRDEATGDPQAGGIAVDCSACEIGHACGPSGWSGCPFSRKRWNAGDMLYLEGEPAERVWFVKRGVVVLHRGGNGDGEGAVTGIRPAGTLIGLETLLRGRYLESARAATDVVLCSLSSDGLQSWLSASPGNALRAILDLSLRTLLGDAARRAAPDASAVGRVAAWLLGEGRSSRWSGVPRQVLAGLLGMRPETLSRALRTLSLRGAIAVTRQEIRVLDAAALERYATEPRRDSGT